MKRFIILSAAMMLSIMLSAQTQQGYVKTKGRMVNGQHIHGQGLKGATVSIKGKTAVLVKTENGAFSFPIPEAQFCIDSVRKKGYQLVDMDALSKTYKHSANPIYLVMETPEQQLQDQLTAQHKIRRTLMRQIQQREDEIETLKEQQRISDEEYHQALQKLYDEADQNEQLVKDMVERYSKIDYDQLSEFDREISELILNGELVKADSMLRTKGDINQRAADYQRHKAINVKEKEELSQRLEQLEQSELLAQKELEDIANDCYRKFEIFKMQHLNDSAAYYIELRANLDTTNIRWQIDFASFNTVYLGNTAKAKKCFEKTKINAIQQYGNMNRLVAECYNNLGYLDLITGNYSHSYENINTAIDILEYLDPEDMSTILGCYNNLGAAYCLSENNTQAIEIFNTILSKLDESNPLYQEEIARDYNNLGYAYTQLEEFKKSMYYYKKGRDLFKLALGEDSPDYAESLNNIGTVYVYQADYDSGLYMMNKALEIKIELFGDNHPAVADAYSNIGTIYSINGQIHEAFNYFNHALQIYQRNKGEKSLDVADSYNSIGRLYYKLSQYEESITYYEKALSIKLSLLDNNHSSIGNIYNNLGLTYAAMSDYDKALEYYNKALILFQNVYGDTHTKVATEYYNIGLIYDAQSDYESALYYYCKSKDILTVILGDEHPTTKKVLESITEIKDSIK